jgi:hypothetical protein
MSPVARRLGALLAVLLVVLALVGLAAWRIGVGPFASPTPVPTATVEPSRQPTPTPDPLAEFGAIEEQVQALRGLPAAEIGPPDVLTRDQLVEELAAVFERDFPPDERAAENAMLRGLGLLSAEQEIGELTLRLYGDQVLGFYDFETKRMVVVTDAGLTPQARITYAHEYTHALQDAAFDTGAASDAARGEDDQSLALVALAEGDASTAMVLWALGHLTPDEMSQITETPIPDTAGVPGWMVRQLEFPYLAGAEFVGQLYAAGGWEAVNAAYADPPLSSEQVIHPQAYLDHEAPQAVEPYDIVGALGAGWRVMRETTLGEAMVAIWLEGIGAAQVDAEVAAEGWGGDRIVVAEGPDGAWALVWRLAWDDPDQATQFGDAYQVRRASLAFAADLGIGEQVTTVIHASSQALVDELLAAE